jgi:hypothetical protein
MMVDSIDYYQPTHDDEYSRRKWMTGDTRDTSSDSPFIVVGRSASPAKDEDAGGRRAEEYEVDGDDVVEDLLITPGKRNHNCQCPLNNDCQYRNLRFWM